MGRRAAERIVPIKHLGDPELDKVMRYMQWVVDFLGLGSIQVIVREVTAGVWNEEGEDEHTLAGVEVADTKHSADLFLCDDWTGLPNHVKESSLVHEGIHILHHRVDLAAYVPMETDAIAIRRSFEYKHAYHREMELVVDRVTRILMPLIPSWDDAVNLPDARTVVRQGQHI